MDLVAANRAADRSTVVTPDLLMRGMAHDLNNMLAVIAAGLVMIDRGSETPGRDAVMDGMRRAVANAATLAQDIVSLTADQKSAVEVLPVPAVLNGMSVLAEGVVGPEIVFRPQIPEDIWPIRTTRAYLEFALLNLIVNAADAMPGGGDLTLRASNARRAMPQAMTVGDFVRIEVIDTGEGIPADVIDRVFEPFFTTKGPVKGTGLGLSQVRRFVDQHGGDVAVTSVVGRGTTFILHLPRFTPT